MLNILHLTMSASPSDLEQGTPATVGGRRTGPDKKTIERVVQRCVESGFAYSVDLEVPVGKQWRKIGNRTTELLIRAGVDLDSELLYFL